MAIKLIALDLDDTLLGSDARVSPRNKAAIAAAQARGVAVTLATGRMHRSAVPYIEELGITTPVISYNGAMIKDPRSGEVFFHCPVPQALAREILEIAYAHRLYANVYWEDHLYIDSWQEGSEHYLRQTGTAGEPVGDLRAFLPGDPSKLLLIVTPETVEEWYKFFAARFGDRLTVTTSTDRYVEFMQRGVSKGAALRALRERLGLAAAEVMAVGDGRNDLEMVTEAGLGVAVGNAHPVLRARARYVTKINDEDGVAEAIEKFVLAGAAPPGTLHEAGASG